MFVPFEAQNRPTTQIELEKSVVDSPPSSRVSRHCLRLTRFINQQHAITYLSLVALKIRHCRHNILIISFSFSQ